MLDIHRENGPALIEIGVEELWYYGGNIHRIDGPATYPLGELDLNQGNVECGGTVIIFSLNNGVNGRTKQMMKFFR